MTWPQSTTVVLALGANVNGHWGAPAQTLSRLPDALKTLNVRIVAESEKFKTPPLGGNHQSVYLNQILLVHTSLAPAALLRKLKTLERAAGRRERGHWAPRPLDIDIIDFKGARNGWPRRRAGSLTLPHTDCHRRPFVLLPLLSVHRHWRHPALRVSGAALLSKAAPHEVAAIKRLNARPPRTAANTQS